MAQCRSCGAAIAWVNTARSGRPAPIDNRPSPNGNVRVDIDDSGALAVTLGGQELERERQAGTLLYHNHFATCPNRERHAAGVHTPPPGAQLKLG